MMLKINKTLPKNKARCINNNNIAVSANRQYIKLYYLGLATLICGIMPGLMKPSYYGSHLNKAYAAEVKTLSDITNMQEMTQAICSNTEIGVSKTLIDTRDNSDYQVAKLSDGNCWMAQNLRLSWETLNKIGRSATLTSADTNVSSDYSLPESGAWASGDDTAQGIIASTNNDYGAYYTWCAATAGCKNKDDNNPTTNMDVTSSICPKGWRLPTGGSNGELYVLYSERAVFIPDTTAGDTQENGWMLGAATEALGGALFPAAGNIYAGDDFATKIGVNGRYWSSTNGRTGAYRLYFDSHNIGINTNGWNNGYSVRCIADARAELDTNISVTVNPTLTLDAVTGAEDIEADPSRIATGTITATISSNTNYIVQLSSNKPDLTDPNHPETEGIKASSNVVKGTNAWGIQNNLNDNTRLSDYSPITTTPTSFHNTETTNPDFSKTHTFALGVSIANTLPSGEYSTTVTVTAVNN